MNKNLALFLLMVVGIAVFAVVVMVHVPRKGAAVNTEAATTTAPGYTLANTDQG